MRVLWFTNIPLPAVTEQLGIKTQGYGGHWMSALLARLSDVGDLKMGIATAFHGLPDASFSDNGNNYYVLAQPRRMPNFSCRDVDLDACRKIVSEFKPDIIHIHGSERFYGLLKSRRLIDVPVVVSLQGLLVQYSAYTNYFGTLSPWNIVRATRIREFVSGFGILHGYRDIKKGARQEAEILSSVNGFLGRTSWDRAHACWRNQNALYRHVGEVLRKNFLQHEWSLDKAKQHSIIFTNAGHPRRGTETLFQAVSILRHEFPDIQLRLAGTISKRSGYGRHLLRTIDNAGLKDCTSLMGYLDAESMAKELSRSHVFAITSFIENSPNSLAEAMQIGMPCVASYVGGIPDMIEDGVTGALFPCGDEALLAQSIRRIFLNDELAVNLGAAARKVAMKRHSPERVVEQLLSAYKDILEYGNK